MVLLIIGGVAKPGVRYKNGKKSSKIFGIYRRKTRKKWVESEIDYRVL